MVSPVLHHRHLNVPSALLLFVTSFVLAVAACAEHRHDGSSDAAVALDAFVADSRDAMVTTDARSVEAPDSTLVDATHQDSGFADAWVVDAETTTDAADAADLGTVAPVRGASSCSADSLPTSSALGLRVFDAITTTFDSQSLCERTSPTGHQLWVAPYDGSFVFTTDGSSFDTVMRLSFAGCSTSDVLCNDDASADSGASRLRADLRAGTAVVISVGGWSPSVVGQYHVNVSGTPIAPASVEGADACDLSSIPTSSGIGERVFGGFTTTAELAPLCDGNNSRVALQRWIAPYDGTFVFTTEGSTFDTKLRIGLDGCATSRAMCHDDVDGGRWSRLTYTLAAGAEVVVAVGSYRHDVFGFYYVNINGTPL